MNTSSYLWVTVVIGLWLAVIIEDVSLQAGAYIAAELTTTVKCMWMSSHLFKAW